MRLLREALHELGPLRRHNHRAARLQRDQLLWQREEEKRDKDAERSANWQTLQEKKNKLLDPIFAQMEVNSWAKAFGGGETGRKVGEFIVEVRRDLPPGTLTGQNQSNPVKPNPNESDLIQPNPTKNCEAAPFPVEPSPATGS
jgi:hypothetical protein